MNLLRRQLITLAALGASLFAMPSVNAGAAEKLAVVPVEEWQLTVKRWLQVLLPLDAKGRGGDSKEVWQALKQLMQNPEFAEGFLAGVQAISTLPLPINNTELNTILRSNEPRAQFLNAFFEIVIESFYGSAPGWEDLKLTQPPQPNGYLV